MFDFFIFIFIKVKSIPLPCPESILFGIMRMFSGLVDAYYYVIYFVFRRNIRRYEFTLTTNVNYRSFKCVDVTFQIDKTILRKGLGSSIVLQNR